MAFHKINGPVFAWHGPGGPVDPGWGQSGGGRPDNDLPWGPGHPENDLPWGPGHPVQLPPLPGIWPKPGEPNIPVVLPPIALPPVYIEGGPLPPPGIYPPLPPDAGIPTGKIAILVWVVGVGHRWLVYDKAQVTPPITGAQAKS